MVPTWRIAALIAACLPVACTSASSRVGVTTARSATLREPPRAVDYGDFGGAHGLVMSATSCWMGGLWSDALGEKTDARDVGITSRCDEVLREINAPAEKSRPLRAIDATIVARIEATIADPSLAALLAHVADGARETMHARLAADVVKEDAALAIGGPTYEDHKSSAAVALGQGQAMRTLLDDKSLYASDAHTVGLLVALDRMEIAHGLPKHLKLEVVAPAYAKVFGVYAPSVRGEPANPPPRGVWLTYLCEVARAAGHPLPEYVTELTEREELAWTSVLAGFADKLRHERAFAERSRLGEVVRRTVSTLDEGYQTQLGLIAAKHSR